MNPTSERECSNGGGTGRICSLVSKGASTADRILGWSSRAAHILAAVTLLLLALVTITSVVARAVFGIALLDHVTPGRLSMPLLAFLTIAWVLRCDEHVAVRIVSDRLPHRPRLVIHAAVMSFALIAVSILIWETSQFALAALRMNEQVIGDILWPAFPFQAAVPCGLTLFALEMVRLIIRDVANAMKANSASPKETV